MGESGVPEPLFFEPQRNVYKADQYRHLYQRTDDGGKCFTGVDPEHRDGNRNGQLKVVAGSRK